MTNQDADEDEETHQEADEDKEVQLEGEEDQTNQTAADLVARVLWGKDTFQDAEMDKYGFVVNTKWKLAICLGCKTGIDAKGLYDHINNEIKPNKVSYEYCKTVTVKFGLLTRNKLKLPTSVIPALFSLPITPNMLYCNRCGYAACIRASILRYHVDQACPNSSILHGPAQTFFPTTRRNFFVVRVPPARAAEPSEVKISTLFKAQFPQLQVNPLIAPPSDVRDTNHFLSLGDWFQEVAGLGYDQVHHIARNAQSDLRPLVRESVNSYIEAMNEELSGVDFAVKVAMGDYNK